MVGNLRKNSEKGFTIIEVLIVLAIAGLIMLIVFLAVPALQRNSRNTQRRNDVSVYLGAVNEWVANSNGRLPSLATDLTAAGTGVNALANVGANTTEPATVLTGVQSTAVALDTLQLVTNAKCDTATVGNTIAATGRAFVLRFAVENSTGGATPQCQEG